MLSWHIHGPLAFSGLTLDRPLYKKLMSKDLHLQVPAVNNTFCLILDSLVSQSEITSGSLLHCILFSLERQRLTNLEHTLFACFCLQDITSQSCRYISIDVD